MAKLYFYYSAMNAGKSTMLLQSSYNYKERGMDTLLFAPTIADRSGKQTISSRIGLSAEAISFDECFDLYHYTQRQKAVNTKLQCILVDEAQFLSKEQVLQLTEIVDKLAIPVLAYGLRSDFQGEPFEGSKYLLIWADNLIEIKTICHCGKKAIMNLRVDAQGQAVTMGTQIYIAGNESYLALCRKHYNEAYKFSSLRNVNIS